MTRDFFLCYFETTRRCNLNCPYCASRQDASLKKNELATDEAKHLVLDEVKRICPQGAVAFSGGEFLLRQDAMELLEYNRRLGLYSFINTNGKCLNRNLLKEIKKITRGKIIFGFSLNSINNEANRLTRDDKTHTVLELIRLCDELGIGYFILTTISKENLSTLAETSDFLKSHKIAMLRSPFVPKGAACGFGHLSYDSVDMEEIIHPILRDNHLCYISYTPFFASPDFIQEIWEEIGLSIGNFGCQAGKGYIGISPEGDVAPCVHLLDTKVVCGNVRERPLSKLLEESQILAGLKTGSSLKGKCGRCRYKHTCGGCRALTYYVTGDYLESDPSCFFEPEDESQVSEHEDIHNRNLLKFVEFLIHNKPWNEIFRPSSLWKMLRVLLFAIKTRYWKPRKDKKPMEIADEDLAYKA